ncbi:MAG: YfhO family protein, partial [Gemmatimonadota bacterium]|nr:YfhO family protein [Gemmatimonadota bacterium]
SHDPGWKASIDGKVVPIHRVDHLFRGVRVDPGDREVIFRYDPPEYRKGAILSLGALLALIAGTLAWGRGTGRASSPSERSAPS